MISARRLGREWALKILYQRDTGGGKLEEAMEGAMERLRMEFVHLGSRRSTGSFHEEICLDWMTEKLLHSLGRIRFQLIGALSHVSMAVLQEGPYWQEQFVERSLKSRLPAALGKQTCLMDPITDRDWKPPQWEELEVSERILIQGFVASARYELPVRHEKILRSASRSFTRELTESRPLEGSAQDQQEFLLRGRRAFNTQQIAYWENAGKTVAIHIEGWLRAATFASQLAKNVADNQARLDEEITSLGQGWSFERMVLTDKEVLRIGAYELLFTPEVPVGVILSEAQSIADKFSTEDSRRFVHGVLSALAGRAPERSGETETKTTEEDVSIEQDLEGENDNLEEPAAETGPSDENTEE